MAESYQPPPFSHPVPQQPQQGIASWYPPPPHPYQPQQQQPPPPPQQHHNMQWPVPPPGDQSFSYSQPLPYHSQGDYYSQQPPHQYPPPLQPSPPQFTYMYGPQDQVWQPNSNWGYQQWAYPGQNASLTQEEVWAAKARAWAASKAAQSETKPVQPGPIAHPANQDFFQQQDPPTQNTLEGQQYSLQPTAPQGAYRVDSISQQGPMQPSSAPRFTPQQPHLLPQSQTSPSVSQPQFNDTEQPSTSGYELHQQQLQQIPPNYQPQFNDTEQPPTSGYELHQQQQQQIPPNYQQQQQQQPPQPQQQSQYQPPPTVMEGPEAEFGLSPAAMQNWAPAGGPGMPFPPAMGAGTAQFDHLHATHQMPVPMFGRSHGPQGVGFPSNGPFVAGPGPALGPGPGTPARPLFIPDGFGERPKKAAVPSWLREELMKKKAAGLAGNSTGMVLSDDSNRVNGGEPAIHLNQRLGISDRLRTRSPGLSDDEEDDEEAEVEAARNAAINQEIKRLLTEVLLKVTGDIFEEIAQEVLEEDDDETFQGKPPVDEQDKSSNPVSPSQAPVPSVPARVLVSSLKNHGTNDDDEKESGASGSAAGDVLGLGEYASDEDDTGTKDLQTSVKVFETRREPRHKEFQENVSTRMDGGDLDHSDRKVQSREIVGGARGNSDEALVLERPSDKEKYRDKDLSMKTYSGKGFNDKEIEREKRRYQEGEKNWLPELNTRSPEPAHASLKDYHTDARNGSGHSQAELAPNLQGNSSSVKEEHRRGFANNMTENDDDHFETAVDQVGRKLLKERSTVGLKGDKQHQDEHESKADSKERPVLGKESSSVTNKTSASSAHKFSVKETSNIKERESLHSHKSADASGFEKKREERVMDNNRKKGTETVRNERSSEVREKDSSRDRRKDKVKEKEKLREREHERERRKTDKGKREREGRSKRRDLSEKKTRHRSSSSSSRHTESRSSSSSSRDTRGRSHTWRSSRRHSSISSPGRPKKRRSASKSPVHRRRHS